MDLAKIQANLTIQRQKLQDDLEQCRNHEINCISNLSNGWKDLTNKPIVNIALAYRAMVDARRLHVTELEELVELMQTERSIESRLRAVLTSCPEAKSHVLLLQATLNQMRKMICEKRERVYSDKVNPFYKVPTAPEKPTTASKRPLDIDVEAVPAGAVGSVPNFVDERPSKRAHKDQF